MTLGLRIVFLATMIKLHAACINYTDPHTSQVSCLSYDGTGRTFNESKDYCKQIYNGDLAMVKSDDMRQFLRGESTLNKDAWIGIQYNPSLGKWFWIDGSELNSSTALWDGDQPKNVQTHLCARQHGGTKGWETKDCISNHKPLCEEIIIPAFANGNWNDWSDWSACSVTCRIGSQSRSRTCTNPEPANGGAGCVGNSFENQECITNQECPYTQHFYKKDVEGKSGDYLTIKTVHIASKIKCASLCSQTEGCDTFHYSKKVDTNNRHTCSVRQKVVEEYGHEENVRRMYSEN